MSRFGRVGVLSGGPSSEREISLRSGRAVCEALKFAGVDAIFLDVWEDICDIIKRNKIDVAFIALHGKFGEDGTVQSILDGMRIPYTGSGAKASSLAIDKIASKKVFDLNGIPTPKSVVFERGAVGVKRADELGYPLVVKPNLEGSSIGLSVVRAKESFEEALKSAFKYDSRVLVEEYIDGRELTVGMVDDEPLPVIEIVPKNKIYDYKAKYADPETKYLVPAPIDEATASRAKELARRSHRALGCRSLSRVDLMMDGSGSIFVLEVNTIPGMTERSLLPKAAAAEGLSFSELCVKLIESALK